MASKLLDRLRRTLFKEGEVVARESIDVPEDSFPESSELEDDTECLSERLGGTLCFDGERAMESEDPGGASGPDSDSDFLGESVEDGFSSTGNVDLCSNYNRCRYSFQCRYCFIFSCRNFAILFELIF